MKTPSSGISVLYGPSGRKEGLVVLRDLVERRRLCDFGVGGWLGVVVPCAAKGTTFITGLRYLVGACVNAELLARVGVGGGTDVGAGGGTDVGAGGGTNVCAGGWGGFCGWVFEGWKAPGRMPLIFLLTSKIEWSGRCCNFYSCTARR